jgi:hypothetical protein
VLERLGSVRWDGLECACLDSAEIPGLLQARASADAGEAQDAEDELSQTVYHQGSVYPATVVAVPFLVELAESPSVIRRSHLLFLLGLIAASGDGRGVGEATVRAAVVAEADRILALTGDPDSEVRELAAYALGQCAALPGPIVAGLAARLEAEAVPMVKASLVVALAGLDRAASLPIGDEDPVVRAAAVYAAAITGRVLDVATVLGACRDGDVFTNWPWDFQWLATALEAADAAVALPAIGELAAAGGRLGEQAMWAAGEWMRGSRSATTRLIPLLLSVLRVDDHELATEVLELLDDAGSAAVLAVQDLVRIAGEGAPRSSIALSTLIRLKHPDWRVLLLRAWEAGQGPANTGDLLLDAGIPADPQLVAAVRARLVLQESDTGGLIRLLGSWGAAAAAAEPELLAVLHDNPWETPTALAAVSSSPAVIEALTAAADATGRTEATRERAAVALYRCTGDAARLVAFARRTIRAGELDDSLTDALLDAGDAARSLIPDLAALLAADPGLYGPRREQGNAAMLHWALARDPQAILPYLPALPAAVMANLAGLIGRPAHHLRPQLRQLLDTQYAVPAARTLWRWDADSDGLIPPLLAAIQTGRWAGPALRLLVTMNAAETLPDLQQLATQDARPVTTGMVSEIIRLDEKLQAELHTAITALTPRHQPDDRLPPQNPNNP